MRIQAMSRVFENMYQDELKRGKLTEIIEQKRAKRKAKILVKDSVIETEEKTRLTEIENIREKSVKQLESGEILGREEYDYEDNN